MKSLTKLAIFSCISTVLSGCVTLYATNADTIFDRFQSRRAAKAPALNTVQVQQKITQGTPHILTLLEEQNQVGAFFLVGENAGVTTWESIKGQSLSIANGALVATRGFGADLMVADLRELPISPDDFAPYSRSYSFLDGLDGIQTRSLVCTRTNGGTETVQISDARRVSATITIETCRNQDLSFENKYWHAGAKLVQSKQWISPENGMVWMLPQ